MATPFPFVSGAVLTAAQMNAITTLPINNQTASYTLLAGDAGKRVIMNVGSANTVTVNDNVFAAGDTIFIANIGTATTTITEGSGVDIETSGSLALAQYGGGTLIALSASTFTFFPAGGIGYGTATGGTSSSITDGGIAYTLLTFTSSGTLTVTKSGLFDVLIQSASGGGGGTSTTLHSSGGGGGGSVPIVTVFLDANQTITLGAKGVGGSAGGTSGTNGTKTTFGSLLVGSPGAGGSGRAQAINNGGAGGGASNGAPLTGGVGFYGGNGGNGIQDGTSGAGGGAGGNASGTTVGAGITSSFTGSSVTYGEGGAAGLAANGTNGKGGGGRNTASSGAGGDGDDAKVFVRFKS